MLFFVSIYVSVRVFVVHTQVYRIYSVSLSAVRNGENNDSFNQKKSLIFIMFAIVNVLDMHVAWAAAFFFHDIMADRRR